MMEILPQMISLDQNKRPIHCRKLYMFCMRWSFSLSLHLCRCASVSVCSFLLLFSLLTRALSAHYHLSIIFHLNEFFSLLCFVLQMTIANYQLNLFNRANLKRSVLTMKAIIDMNGKSRGRTIGLSYSLIVF